MTGAPPRLNQAAIRPNPTLGQCYYVPEDPTGARGDFRHNMLVAYRFPPSIRHMPDSPASRRLPVPAFWPDSVIGPVVGVDHTITGTDVLINGLWVTIWSRPPPRRPRAPGPAIGAMLLLPTRASYLQIPPTWTEGWDHPFQDLWPYTADLGISHLAAQGRHLPPRFLLTGAAWYRLFLVHTSIRLRPGAALRVNLTFTDRLLLARALHPALDFPPIPNGPHPNPGLALIQRCDVFPRRRVETFLRSWVRRRRAAKADEYQRHLYYCRLLPPPALPLGNVLQSISECL